MSNILITGCAGLIGSHLSRYLIERGHAVTGVDDLSGGYEDWLPNNPGFKFFKEDLAESEHLESIFLNGNFDTVFHLAAYAAEGLSPFIRVFNYKNNVIASANIINKCVNYDCKLVFTSSMAVYGSQKPPFLESMPCVPIDPYGNAKALIEKDIEFVAIHPHMKYHQL
jgi:UDP-glucose 4-epimerase